MSGSRPAGASGGPQCPIKLSWQSACVRFGGSLHRAQAPSPPPAVGGQSCLHWGCHAVVTVRLSPHAAQGGDSTSRNSGPLGSSDQLPGRRSSVHTTLPDLGFSTLGSRINVGFSRRQSVIREVDFHWNRVIRELISIGERQHKAYGAPSPPRAHTALTALRRGRRGLGL